MGSPVFVPRPAGVRRFLRPVLVAVTALSVVTCAEDPIGPAINEGRLRVVPVFEVNARLAPLAIDRVRVMVARIPASDEQGEVVVDDTIPFDLGNAQLTIRDIRVPMKEQTEDFLITLQMLSNTVILFEGSQSVTLIRGRTSSSSNIPMTYQGPGANVASIAISPRDTTIAPGATFTFGLQAFDAQGAPVPQFYASWSLTGGPANGASINAAGQLKAPSVRDTFYVKVVNLPTLATDSTRVIIAPNIPPPPTQVIPTPLAAGSRQTCEIRSAGTFCWGSNNRGQLGDGTTTTRFVPTRVSGNQVFVAVSSGYEHSCGLTSTGQAFCWGDNSTGALGDGSSTEQHIPVAVAGGFTYAQIAAANGFTCAVTLQGEGRCWGANFDGQLGDGTTTDRNTPTLVTGGHVFTRISADGLFDSDNDHACAIDAAGAAWCWGDNSNGQLGNGSVGGNQPSPAAVDGGLVFAEISVGQRTSCALTTSGEGYCWGFNFGAQLTAPTLVGGGFSYTTIDMGGNHVCGKTATGWLCGGSGTSGQLGDGGNTDRQIPVAPSGGRTFSVLAAGGVHTCGITTSGTFCWGNNNSGQLGTGDTEGVGSSVPVAAMGAPATLTITAGNNQTAPVNTDVSVPPQVKVVDAAGQPVVGVEVTFTVTAGGGTINGGALTETDFTGAGGLAEVTWTMGAAGGANTMSAQVASAGVTGSPASFTATAVAAAPNVRTWTGAISFDWGNPGNWNPAQVPSVTDSVVIGTASRQPSLVNFQQVALAGAVSIGSGGDLDIAGQSMAITRGLRTSGTGLLTLVDPNSILVVGGDVVFDGGSEQGQLTDGSISVGGNFTQRATTSPLSFAASGQLLTVLNNTASTVDFASPATSHFQELAWLGGGTLTLASPVTALGNMTITGQAAGTISSAAGSRLTAGNLITVAGLTLNDVPLTISTTAGGTLALSNIVFQAMPTNVSQLVISHPGSGSAFGFSNLQFQTTPIAPNGFYLDVTDNDGAASGVLTINLTGAAPASGGAFVRTTGGAVVNWPFNSLITWTGAVSTDWSIAGNWNPAQVPGPSDNVAIVATTLQPTLSSGVTVNNVTISTLGARLTVGGKTLTVNGTLGTHTDGLLVMTDPNDRVIVQGDAFFQGGNETGLLTAGELQLFGGFTQQQQTTPLSFVASGSHRTVMRGTASLQEVTFCCTANSSGFQNLDMSQSMGINIQFAGNGVFVFDTLISRPGAGPTPWLYTLGKPLTARRFNIDRLTVDRGTLTLNEQGVVSNQLFDNITFQNYLPTQTQLAITAAGGSPNRTLTFNNLAFQPLTAGDAGKYLTVTSSTQTLILNLPGASPVANGPAFTTVSGAATVNWPAISRTWVGPAGGDWFTAANWNPSGVPTTTDDVLIQTGASVSLTACPATAGTKALTVQTGAALTGACTINARGNVDIQGSTVPGFLLDGAGTTMRGNFATVQIGGGSTGGTVSLAGNVAAGAFTVFNATLTVNGHTLTIGGDLDVGAGSANSKLVMTGALDSLIVNGNTQFRGASEASFLTAGVMILRGNFAQAASGGSPASFAATGTHKVVLEAPGNTVSFTSPGSSNFRDLTIRGSRTLSSVIPVTGKLSAAAADNVALFGTGSLSVTGDLNVTGMTSTGVPVVFASTGTPAPVFDNVSFQTMSQTVNQFDFTAAGGSFTFNALTFGTVPTSGFYVRASGPVTMNLVGATPATGGGFVQTAGGAVVNWPAIATLTWTGATNTDWHTASNWSPVVAPNVGSNVVIPSGTANAPTMSTTFSTINSLVVSPGATLTLNTFSLTVAGNVDVGGTIAGTAAVVMTGTATVRGTVPNLTINGAATLNGNATSTGTVSINGATADLRLGGFTLVVNNLLTQNGATLTMTNPADSLVATGSPQFAGGSTLGKLTAGVIELRASLIQSGGSTTGFASTGTRVRATGNSTVTYTFNNGGASTSRFSSLIVSKSGGTLNLSGTTVVATDSISVSTATPVSVSGTLLPLRTLRLAAGAGLSGVGTVRMTADSLFVATPANYTIQFTDFNGTGPQLIPALNYTNVTFSGNSTHTLTGTTIASGAVNVGTGSLVMAGRRFTANLFNLSGTAIVNMTQPFDSLLISGNTTWAGGDETPFMTSGVLRIGGGLTLGAATSFVASGTHKTIFAGTTPQALTIPNGGAAASRFQDVEIRNTGTGVTLGTAGQIMQVNGTLSLPVITTLAGAGTVVAAGVNTAAGSTLSVFSLTAPASAFSALGIYGVNQTFLTGGGVVPVTTYNNLTLTGNYTLGANLATIGNLETQNQLDISARTVAVAKTFRTTGNGVLVMANPSTQMTADSAVFTGGNETGLLTDGVLTITNVIVQRSTNSPSSFVASGNHTLNLTGAVVTVDFDFFTRDQSPVNHLSSSAGNTFISWLRVNGNATFSGNNVNASTFNVRGTLTTAAATGVGMDSLIIGGAMAAGNGYIAASHYIFDQTTGTQTIPAQNANLPYSDNNADITVRSNAVLGGTITGTNRLVIDGTGTLALNGQRATVLGNFSTAGTGVLNMNTPLDSLIVNGNAGFNGGDEFGSLTDGNLILAGNFSHATSQFRATNNHRTVFTGPAGLISSTGTEPRFNDLTITGITTLATPTIAIRDLVLQASARLNSQTTQDLRGVRNVSAANASQVTPFLLEASGTITSSGLVSPNTLIFTGTGVIPASSANIVYQRIQVGQASTGYTLGGTVSAPNGIAVFGPLTIGANTLTVNDLSVAQTTGRLIMTNAAGLVTIATIASFDGGDETGSLTAGTIRFNGSFNQSSTNSPNSFRATGTHSVIFGGTGASQVGFATAGSQFQNVLIDMPSGSTAVTAGTMVAAGNLSVTRGRFQVNGHTVDVGQNLSLSGSTSIIAMQNPSDSLIVGNAATFAGASTTGLLTAGVLRVSGDFTQNATVSTTSFAPSGTHKTVLGSAAGGNLSIGSPGAGAGGSHFQVLDVTPATGGLTLDVNMQADSLISTSNLAKLISDGQTLTVRRAQISGLTSNGVPLILDEEGVASTENLSGLNFTAFPTTGTTMLKVLGPGNSFAPRPTVTANNDLFQSLPVGAGNFYVDLTTTNDQAFTLNMVGSNQRTAAGGNGPTLTRLTGVGAAVNWP